MRAGKKFYGDDATNRIFFYDFKRDPNTKKALVQKNR
tara:strand:+ start:4359 stop:4469 length:111 start_codon:yes stop_codon:yes gene_type:complete